MKTTTKATPTRRQFLTEVGRGTLAATIGPALAAELGLAGFSRAAETSTRLSLGGFEPLAGILEQTALDKLQPVLLQKLRSGLPLKDLVAAAALVNARRFGGEDYVGFHTFMAMIPALHMAELMPKGREALPVLKVLYRNAARVQDSGRADDALGPLHSADVQNPTLREHLRSKNKPAAERALAMLHEDDRDAALAALIEAVCENPEVHRTVLPWRAWDMATLVGPDHALTLLRQSVHYCIDAERSRKAEWDQHGKVLTRMLDAHQLHRFKPGTKAADDALVNELATTFATKSPDEAAEATASLLAEGIDPKALGEALSLAASHLVLRDPGRQPQYEGPGKPPGSVHGDSIGVHASDAANAWRNLAFAGDGRHLAACLVMGSWIIARDRGAHVLPQALPPMRLVESVKSSEAESLPHRLREAIQNNLQAHAAAIVEQMGHRSVTPATVFSILLEYAVSEDGALHAEKYFHTVWDDFQHTRPSLRWQHLTALARVTASEYGRPAPGQEQARELVGI